MPHRWSPEDIGALIHVALQCPARGPARDRVAAELAEELSRASPANPLTESAARYALDVAVGALEGRSYGASEELLRQVAACGRGAAAPQGQARRLLSLEARGLELAIDACLAFPPSELEERRSVFAELGLEPPATKYFAGIDNAIAGAYDATPRPSPPVRTRVEERRRNGELVRRW